MDEQSELAQLKVKFEELERRVKELEGPVESRWGDIDLTFEDFVTCCDFRCLRQMIRETSIEAWAKASVTLPIHALEKIRNNISERSWEDFVGYAQEMKYSGSIESSRKEIMRTLQQLESMGEIVIAWDTVPKSIKRGESISYSGMDVSYKRPEPDPEVMEWLETVLVEAGKLPRQRPDYASGIQV